MIVSFYASVFLEEIGGDLGFLLRAVSTKGLCNWHFELFCWRLFLGGLRVVLENQSSQC